MSRPPLKVAEQLEASLRRVSGALEQNRGQYAAIVGQMAAAAGAEAERVPEAADTFEARVVERHRRGMDRLQRRAARRQERAQREDAAAVPRGIVFAVAAIACVIFAIVQPEFFWMLFVALGLGLSAADAFGRAATRRRLEREPETGGGSETVSAEKPVAAAAAEPADPKVARIQGLCDKLLEELKSGPPIVREVVTEPQATIDGLRRACVETARRERELRTVLEAQDEAGLVAERDALAARLSNEHDAVVRDRLGQALAALDQRVAHRAELATAAARLEAENTRILYTLENLHMQLLRARSTDMGAPELGGALRDSLRELGTEIDAVAEALEWASGPAAADEGTATGAPGSGAASGPEASPAAEEKAQREAAARRAAQAREAQRH